MQLRRHRSFLAPAGSVKTLASISTFIKLLFLRMILSYMSLPTMRHRSCYSASLARASRAADSSGPKRKSTALAGLEGRWGSPMKAKRSAS